MKPFLRIEPYFLGTETAVTQYKVVDQNGTIQFTGSYYDCYDYLHPIPPNMYRNVWEAGDGTINK